MSTGGRNNGEAADRLPPLVLRWEEPGQLPRRSVRSTSKSRPRIVLDAPPWLSSGPADKPFDFCKHIRRLCADVTTRCPELAHIDVSRLLFAVTQARSGRTHGLQARVTPLRFAEGRLTRKRRGVCYQVQRFVVGQREMLYLMTFCLPRFLDQEFDDKFVTLFHELYHISPAFDGDLRRHSGRYEIHSHSQRNYDEYMAHLARGYLAGKPDPILHSFLRLNFAQLQQRHGDVLGVMLPRPKLVPVEAANRRGPA